MLFFALSRPCFGQLTTHQHTMPSLTIPHHPNTSPPAPHHTNPPHSTPPHHPRIFTCFVAFVGIGVISVSVGVIAGFIMAKEAQARRHLTNKIGAFASPPLRHGARGLVQPFSTYLILPLSRSLSRARCRRSHRPA